MTSNQWKKRIVNTMIEVGTYQPSFDDAIGTLAGILERRDELEKELKNSKAAMIVKRTNARGHENIEQNPAFRLLNDMNRDALTFWRDFGLTPKGLKAITDNSIAESKADPLNEILKKMGR